MTELRDQIADAIGCYLASLVSGNNMPDMSGDPRNRISPGRRRYYNDACREAADAILALPAIATALAGRAAVLEEAARVAEADVPADCSYGPGMGIARNIRALATAPAPSGWRDVATDPPPKDALALAIRIVEEEAAAPAPSDDRGDA